MALQDTNEISSEYLLSADGQVALRVGERIGPFETPRLNYRKTFPLRESQTELNLKRELHNQEALLQNVIATSLREQANRHFFEHVESTAQVIELPPPTETDTIVEFPPTLQPAA